MEPYISRERTSRSFSTQTRVRFCTAQATQTLSALLLRRRVLRRYCMQVPVGSVLVFGGPLLGDTDRDSMRRPSLRRARYPCGEARRPLPARSHGLGSLPLRGALRSQVRARASGVGYSPLGRPAGDAAQHVLDAAGRVGADQNYGLGLPARPATPATSASRYRSQVHCFGEVNTSAMGATSRTTRAG
jgi:hypothetical protein